MSELDLRKDWLITRIKGLGAGDKHVLWSAKDMSRLQDHADTVPLSVLRSAAASMRKEASRSAPLLALRAMSPDDMNFRFVVTTNSLDRSGDIVEQGGIDWGEYLTNPVVQFAHASDELPIATSSTPYRVGNGTQAIAKFPPTGVAPSADQCAAAVRAGLLRGASIGFIPLEWTLAKERDRPFGLNFKRIKVIEYSLCAIPCNPDCLLQGPVDAKSVDGYAVAARQAEAKNLISLVGKSAQASRPASMTREQRLAEARRLINAVRR
jgi:hypothetical protein